MWWLWFDYDGGDYDFDYYDYYDYYGDDDDDADDNNDADDNASGDYDYNVYDYDNNDVYDYDDYDSDACYDYVCACDYNDYDNDDDDNDYNCDIMLITMNDVDDYADNDDKFILQVLTGRFWISYAGSWNYWNPEQYVLLIRKVFFLFIVILNIFSFSEPLFLIPLWN